MIIIRKYMFKAAGYKVRCENNEILFQKAGETMLTICNVEDKHLAKWDKGSIQCEKVIVNIARGRLFFVAYSNLQEKFIQQSYVWL